MPELRAVLVQSHHGAAARPRATWRQHYQVQDTSLPVKHYLKVNSKLVTSKMSMRHLGWHRGRQLIHGLVPCPARVGLSKGCWFAEGRSRTGSPSSCCLSGWQRVGSTWPCKICLSLARQPQLTGFHRKRVRRRDHGYNSKCLHAEKKIMISNTSLHKSTTHVRQHRSLAPEMPTIFIQTSLLAKNR